jgi:chromosome segregation ATPase
MASSKSASDELSERCDELTRELQRCRLALQDSKNTVEVLERDAHEHETTLRDAQDTISKLEESLKSSTEMQRAQMTSLERKFQSEIEDLKADLFNTRSALADAKRDVEMLQQDKESSESAAKNLDEYKKKAQAALKKVSIVTSYSPPLADEFNIFSLNSSRRSR